MSEDKILRDHLVTLLKGHGAHVDMMSGLQNVPLKAQGTRPAGSPHSPWELIEHIRLTQADILDYIVNPEYRERSWPDDYWPKASAPSSSRAWKESCDGIRADLDRIIGIVSDPARDLTAQIPHGEKGHTILRETLLVADHNAYHLGQMVTVRKILDAWEKKSR